MAENPPYSRPESVVCIGSVAEAKAAALYFDHVVPLMYSRCPDEVLLPADHASNGKLQVALAVISLAIRKSPARHLGDLPLGAMEVRIHRQSGDSDFYPIHVELSDEEREIGDAFVASSYVDLADPVLRHFAVDIDMPLLAPGPPLEAAATDEDVSIVLSGLPVVDTSKASWEQIIEYRKDPQAKEKLRRLRLFAHENFTGRSRAFIEDRIGDMLDGHKAAAKDHGLETLTGTLTLLAESKSLLATGAATLATSLAAIYSPGTPAVATAAALTGGSAISLEVGKLVLNFVKARHAFHKVKRDHSLAYIIEAQDRLT